MSLYYMVIFVTGMLLLPFVCCSSNGEGDVIKRILMDYSVDERPVKASNMAAKIEFGFKLNSFLDLSWKDERLTWNPITYNGTASVRIPVKKLWMPDIVLYNSAEDTLSSSTSDVKTKVSVQSSGMCTLIAPLRYKSMCSVQVKNFPYDFQKCDLIFGSWTLDKTQLVIKELGTKATTYLSEQFSGNGQWRVKKIKVNVEDKLYSGIKNPYSQLRITFNFERKPLYFLLYLILPCVLVSILILLVFIIPPSSGERLGLGITVILNMSVYLLVVSDNLPESSDESPLLGVFYVVMIYEMTIAFILSGITLWISSWQTKLPKIVHKMFFQWPRQKTLRKLMGKGNANESYPMENLENDGNLRRRASSVASGPKEDNGDVEIKKTESREEIREPVVEKTWADVGRNLDKVLFFFFLILFLLTTFGTVYIRPDVSLGNK